MSLRQRVFTWLNKWYVKAQSLDYDSREIHTHFPDQSYNSIKTYCQQWKKDKLTQLEKKYIQDIKHPSQKHSQSTNQKLPSLDEVNADDLNFTYLKKIMLVRLANNPTAIDKDEIKMSMAIVEKEHRYGNVSNDDEINVDEFNELLVNLNAGVEEYELQSNSEVYKAQ